MVKIVNKIINYKIKIFFGWDFLFNEKRLFTKIHGLEKVKRFFKKLKKLLFNFKDYFLKKSKFFDFKDYLIKDFC